MEELIDRINALLARADAPIIVAIDGRSGAGKSTLASEVAARTGAPVIEGDDFYAGGTAETWDAMTPAERASHCIDWRRIRTVLEPLARGTEASWHAYDWDADDWDADGGRLKPELIVCAAAPLVILEGAYSARPELADLLALRVLFEVPEAVRRAQLLERSGEDFLPEWDARWASAEEHYFANVMPRRAFDLVVTR